MPLPIPTKPVNDGKPPQADDLAKRIRVALAKISPAQNTATRSVIDLYYGLITTKPFLVTDGDSNFPRNPKFHPVNTERFVVKDASKPNLLIQHLGAAILGMYKVANLIHESMQVKGDQAKAIYVQVQPAVDKAEPRVYILEQIARYGLDGFAIEGDESDGYTLYRPPVVVNPVAPPVDRNIKAADVGAVNEDLEENV